MATACPYHASNYAFGNASGNAFEIFALRPAFVTILWNVCVENVGPWAYTSHLDF